MSEAPEISVTDVPADAVLLDVREGQEWAAGHVEGSVHVPMGDVPVRLADLPAARPLYVVCRSGARSGRTVEWLNEQGIESVNVAGGLQAWAAVGKPITSSTGSPRVI